MTAVEQQLDTSLRKYYYDKMRFETEKTYENFYDSKEEKEFERVEIGEEQYTIDNLLDIIDSLEEKLKNLTDDYNNLLSDSCEAMEDIVYSIPDYEEV